MENEVRLKINGEEVKERSAEEIEADVVKKTLRREQLEFDLRAKLADGQNKAGSSDEESSDEEDKK